MTFQEMLADDLEIFFDADEGFAIGAQYEPFDGSPAKAILVIIDYEGALAELAFGQEVSGFFWIKADDVAEPKNKDKINVGGVRFMVESVADGGDGLIFKLKCRRDVRVNHG